MAQQDIFLRQIHSTLIHLTKTLLLSTNLLIPTFLTYEVNL